MLEVKNLPANAGVWSRGREAPLEEGMTTCSTIRAWRIPWTEEPGRLQPMGSHRVGRLWSPLPGTDRRWRNRPSRLPAAWWSQGSSPEFVWWWKAELRRKWRALEESTSTSLVGRPNIKSVLSSFHWSDCRGEMWLIFAHRCQQPGSEFYHQSDSQAQVAATL